MKYLILSICGIILFSCNKKNNFYSEEQIDQFKQEFENYINEKNEYFKSEDSPLLKKDIPGFVTIHYFDYNPNFRFEGPIQVYSNPDTVIIYGTKKDERPALKYGYFEFAVEDKIHQLQIFKMIPRKPEQQDYLFLGFTDATSNDETYGGGRYINLELNDTNYYVIDFNYAYNPYCAYNPRYSCAIPSSENHLSIAILAGEKKYHD